MKISQSKTAVTATNKSYLRYSGLAGVIILWTAITVGMVRVPLSLFDMRPLSYLGVNMRTAGLFSIALILSAILFAMFGFYLRAQYRMKSNFLTALLVGLIGQIIVAIVPYGGAGKVIHTAAALGVLAPSLPILTYLFAKDFPKGRDQRLAYRMFDLELICFVLGIGWLVIVRTAAPLSQILPALAYHAWIITFTFRRTGTLIFSRLKN